MKCKLSCGSMKFRGEVDAIYKLLILDVDGTLTDGAIYYGSNSTEIKGFNVKDGLILKVLPRLGIAVMLLTGRESEAVNRRASELGATVKQNIDDKLSVVREVTIERGVEPMHCAYIGDDLNDYGAMRPCGFKACPADAADEIREICDYVSPYGGGHGAVRDICEYMLRQVGKYDEFLSLFGALRE